VLKVKREIWICVGLALLIAAVYGRVGGYPFIIYDDPDYITSNPIVKRGLTTQGLAWAFGRLHGESTYWHPLTWVSHMVDVELFGLNAAGHHVMNVLFHTVNAVLLFLLCRQMTGTVWRSAIVAALFGLHPLQVDTAAWVTERKNLLSAMFWMLTTIAYVSYGRTRGIAKGASSPPSDGGEGVARGDARPTETAWHYRGSYVLMIVLFALGLMCKPAIVTLPFVLLLLDFWPLRRWGNVEGRRLAGTLAPPTTSALPNLWPLIAEKVPLFVLSAVSSWITSAAHTGLGMTGDVHKLTLGMRIENAIVSYGRYLGKIMWPSDLAVIYPHPGIWPRTTVYLSAAVLLIITIAVLRNFRGRPYAAVGWFWFLGTLVPAIGIVQVGMQAMADRFVYIPVIGIFLIIVWSVGDWAVGVARGAWFGRAAAAGAVAACAVATWFQLGHWRNSDAVFEQAVKVTPRNYVAHLNLAVLHATRGETNEVVAHAMDALRAYPLGHEPYVYLGLARERVNDMAGAISNYNLSLKIKPDWLPARKGLASALATTGEFAKAETEFLKLAQAVPGDPEVHARLAEVYTKQQKAEAALASYRKSLELDPMSPPTLNNIAWMLATWPDEKFRNGPEAVQYAERACALTQRKVPMLLGTLAAAYAEAGRFEDATRTAEEARKLAERMGDLQIAQANTKLLELYRTRTPYRQGQQPL
jgi:protein O-mannosyl-transferase